MKKYIFITLIFSVCFFQVQAQLRYIGAGLNFNSMKATEWYGTDRARYNSLTADICISKYKSIKNIYTYYLGYQFVNAFDSTNLNLTSEEYGIIKSPMFCFGMNYAGLLYCNYTQSSQIYFTNQIQVPLRPADLFTEFTAFFGLGLRKKVAKNNLLELNTYPIGINVDRMSFFRAGLHARFLTAF